MGAQLIRMRGGPTAVVFLVSACVMVIEIVAGRLIAGYLGSSLYTWTSVIGVVLAGIAIGNHVGGTLADRLGAERIIGPLLLLGSLCCVGMLGLSTVARDADLFAGLTWPARIATTSAFVFLLPSAALGTISPAVTTAALAHAARSGRTIGALGAAGAIGSVAGTFLAGFYLLGVFGTTAIVWGVAATLALLGLPFLVRPSAQLAGAVLGGLGIAASASTTQGDGWVTAVVDGAEQRVEYARDTDYFRVGVTSARRFDPRSGLAAAHPDAHVLILDAMVHGMQIPGHPERLIYTYERLTEQLSRAVVADRSGLATLFIGGGAYTFPRFVEATYPPDTVIDVVEIDPGVTEAVYEAMDLPRNTRIRTINQDARLIVRSTEQTYDLVYGDAFNGFAIPAHLTTAEFLGELDRRLRPGGAYILNIVDSPRTLALCGAMFHTLRTRFEEVAIYTVKGEHDRQTFVLYASHVARALPDVSGREDSRRLSEAELAALPGQPLTDELAPVDQLIAPIYAERRAH